MKHGQEKACTTRARPSLACPARGTSHFVWGSCVHAKFGQDIQSRLIRISLRQTMLHKMEPKKRTRSQKGDSAPKHQFVRVSSVNLLEGNVDSYITPSISRAPCLVGIACSQECPPPINDWFLQTSNLFCTQQPRVHRIPSGSHRVPLRKWPSIQAFVLVAS